VKAIAVALANDLKTSRAEQKRSASNLCFADHGFVPRQDRRACRLLQKIERAKKKKGGIEHHGDASPRSSVDA
jgi:hypothetical protein